MKYIMDTKTGILHTKECGDKTAEAGNRKYHVSIENAKKDPSFKAVDICL